MRGEISLFDGGLRTATVGQILPSLVARLRASAIAPKQTEPPHRLIGQSESVVRV